VVAYPEIIYTAYTSGVWCRLTSTNAVLVKYDITNSGIQEGSLTAVENKILDHFLQTGKKER
jgi:hypothetical protein